MGSAQVAQDSIGRAPTVALEGKVVSDGEIPAPLSNVQLGLYRQEKERWKEITRLSSSPDGRFRITQKLISGSYEIRVTDPRYQGSLPVYLESKPITDLIVPAHRK
jgi:5-hydroxyisourate hydrolase-like protein (transthyretin family)